VLPFSPSAPGAPLFATGFLVLTLLDLTGGHGFAIMVIVNFHLLFLTVSLFALFGALSSFYHLIEEKSTRKKNLSLNHLFTELSRAVETDG
jgi:hypothetical protein